MDDFDIAILVAVRLECCFLGAGNSLPFVIDPAR